CADHVEERERRHVGVEEDEHADGDAGEAREDEPAATLARAADGGAEADDAAGERERAEDDHEGVEADARPDDDQDAPGDGDRAVDPEGPAGLRDLRPHVLRDLMDCRIHDDLLVRLTSWTLASRPSVRISENAELVRDLRIGAPVADPRSLSVKSPTRTPPRA